MDVDDQKRSVHEFKIDLKGVIKILAQHLYPEKDVFIREMLQNAHDSLKRRKNEEANEIREESICIRVDPVLRTISFTDNGRGLTESEIHDYLATIGRSGTDEFRQKLLEQGRQAEVSLIGRFGIGLLSTFIVADQVEVVTHSSLPDQPTWRWVSSGEKEYTLEKVIKPSDESSTHFFINVQKHDVQQMPKYPQIGTTITLTISAGKHEEFLHTETIRRAIRKYADFLPIPIYLNSEDTPTNVMKPPWHGSYKDGDEDLDEYYVFLSKRYPDPILHVIPMNPANVKTSPRIYGALYIPDHMVLDVHGTGVVDIYQSGVFVQEGNRDLLPSWAKFVRGVLDSPDLTLTLARDSLQKDAAFIAAQEEIGRVIKQDLMQIARHNPKKLHRLLDRHAAAIKMIVLADDDLFDELADEVLFESNHGLINLRTYFQEQSATNESGDSYLYYFTKNSGAVLYYLLWNEKGLIVINASQIPDKEFLERYARKHSIEFQLVNVLESDSLFTPLNADERRRFSSLQSAFRPALADIRGKVQVVHFRPKDMPAILVQKSEDAPYGDLESTKENTHVPKGVRMMIEQALSTHSLEAQAYQPPILYVNADSPLIQRLCALDLESDVAKNVLIAIKNNSRLLAMYMLNRTDIEAINRQFNQMIDLLVKNAVSLEKALDQQKVTSLALHGIYSASISIDKTKYVTCFVVLPPQGYAPLLAALRMVLEDKPYFWRITSSSEENLELTDNTVLENIASGRVDLTMLRQLLATFFNESELHDICLDLRGVLPEIEYESLSGQGKGDKCRELVAYVERRGCTSELVALCRRLRPNTPWHGIVQTASSERLNRFHKHISQAHCYIAEVTDRSFSVGFALGLMQQFPERPKLLLRRADAKFTPVDIEVVEEVPYPPFTGLSSTDLVDHLRIKLAGIGEFQEVRGEMHHLSLTMLRHIRTPANWAEQIAAKFITVEEFIETDPNAVDQELDMLSGICKSIQEKIRSTYGFIK